MSRQLPDFLWLDSMTEAGFNVQINGKATTYNAVSNFYNNLTGSRYFENVVMGSISSGAEVVAGGSIHVYGAIRGRAMAGANGNASARIFCSKVEAELLAIDGYYCTAEDMDRSLLGRPAHAWLDGEALMMAALE